MDDLLIRGARLSSEEEVDILVGGGRISGVLPPSGSSSTPSARRVLSARGLHVLPGVIDTQVHFRDPGYPQKETFETGSRAAVLGGVTGVFDMPNTEPATVSIQSLRDKCSRAAQAMLCHYAFYIGYTGENLDAVREAVVTPGCCGVKVFMGSSTGALLVEDDEALESLLTNVSALIAVHAEDEARLEGRRNRCSLGHPETHAVWRDAEVALKATRRIVNLARKVGRRGRLHILHVSTREEISFLAQHKDLVTFEVTPQHLTLCAPHCYDELGTLAQMNPPIRDETHQDALWEGVRSGLVDVVGSDHAPHTLAEKSLNYPRSPSGMPGVQTLLPVMLNHVNEGHLSLQRLVELTSRNVARTFGLQDRGAIQPGYQADLTFVDLRREETIQEDWLASQCGWSPFSGMTVKGWPVGTIVGGRVVVWDGVLVDEACHGKPFTF